MIDLRQRLTEYFNSQKPGEVPTRQLWAEVLGFFIIFFGIFVAIALIGYDSNDYSKISSGDKNLQNLVGPLGALIAHSLIHSLGVVSYYWAPAIILWGLLLATGIIRRPKKRRFIVFVLVSISIAAILEVAFPQSSLPFGQGGRIGAWLGQGAVSVAGKMGAVLFYVFTGIASVIFTRNMSFTIPTKKKKGLSSEDLKPSLDDIEEQTAQQNQQAARSRKVKNEEGDELLQELFEEEFRKDSGTGRIDMGPAAKAPSRPNPNIFKPKSITVSDSPEDAQTSKLLTEKLGEFKVKGEIVGVTQGPVVKTYQFEPAAGTKVSKIEALQVDLARLLMTESLRVVPVPGSTTMGFEIPNPDRKVIPFGNLIAAQEFKSRSQILPIAMGVDTFGNPIVEDLASMPHLLVAGSTGSGKSVFINTLISSLLVRHSAKDLRMILIDPKMVEFSVYEKIAHLACPVVTDIEKDGLQILQALVDQMELRYKYLNQVGAKNIHEFNEKIKTTKKSKYKKFTGKWQTMPYVVLVVDEFADMIMALGKQAEQSIARLAQKARAAGIHIVIATQRPSVQVVTGVIKANFPTRVGFRVTSGVDSRTILDQSGAEGLLGKGDMLFLSPTGLKRLHSGYMNETELTKLVKLCK